MWQHLRKKYVAWHERFTAVVYKYFGYGINRHHDNADRFYNGRLALVIGVAVSTIGIYIIILVAMTIASSNTYHKLASKNKSSELASLQSRINIVDRNGEILATDLQTMSLYARLSLVDNADILATEIVGIFPDIDIARLSRRLTPRRFGEILIRKNLSPQEQERVLGLNQAALFFQNDIKRVYPKEPLAGHIIGYTDTDNNGIAGLELYYDEYLNHAENPPLKLTIDYRLQNVIRNSLLKTIQTYKAQGAAAILTNIYTGEILAAVSLPDFDANHRNDYERRNFFYKITQGVYEIGSVFKIFTLANGYENGSVTVGQKYDVSKHTFEQDGFKIRDEYIKSKILTAEQILAYSSNIGTIQMILAIGRDKQKAFLKELGFLSPITNMDFPAVGEPLYPHIWRDSNTITISYGYGIAATPLHVIRATNAVINGGLLINPKFVLEPVNPKHFSEKIHISPETSAKMLQAMRLVVTAGSGRAANIDSITVAGKTGTARKLNPQGGYLLNAHMASFIAIFPMEHPLYSLLVIVDDAKMPDNRRHITPGGGAVATPAAAEIITESLPFLPML